MTKLVIVRSYYRDCTISRTHVTGTNFRCLTLELPDKDNERGVSCIPEGEYWAFKRTSSKNGKVYQLEDVPNRTYIQGHSGNFTYQIEGCQLHGNALKYLNDDDVLDVVNSKSTLKRLLSLLPDRFEVVITHGSKP